MSEPDTLVPVTRIALRRRQAQSVTCKTAFRIRTCIPKPARVLRMLMARVAARMAYTSGGIRDSNRGFRGILRRVGRRSTTVFTARPASSTSHLRPPSVRSRLIGSAGLHRHRWAPAHPPALPRRTRHRTSTIRCGELRSRTPRTSQSPHAGHRQAERVLQQA